MIFRRNKPKLDPTRWHVVMAWKPLTFVDRVSGKTYTAWLSFVSRRLVTPAVHESKFDPMAVDKPAVYEYALPTWY